MNGTHEFCGKLIDCSAKYSPHVLFRKAFELNSFKKAEIYISFSGSYKLYINGLPVGCKSEQNDSGRAYDVFDITDYLLDDENVLALHTCRSASSDEQIHGLLLDIVIDGKTAVSSDKTFLCHTHTGFAGDGNNYNSRNNESDFEYPDYDDSEWENALEKEANECTLYISSRKPKATTPIKPTSINKTANEIVVDFGKSYNGYLYAEAEGVKGTTVIISYSANDLSSFCESEKWLLSGNYDILNWFFHKKVRSVKINLPHGAKIETESIRLLSID